MTMKRILAFIIINLISITYLAKGNRPYNWPSPPAKENLQKFMHYNSRTGLIILKRTVDLKLNFSDGENREEFLRILVLNDKGARNARAEVSDREGSELEFIEARTVKPDGSVLGADKEKDIHLMKVGNLRKKSLRPTMAMVNFPGAIKGAILDLHFKIHNPRFTFFWVNQVSYGQSPSLETDYRLEVNEYYRGTYWNVNFLGDRSSSGKLKKESANVMTATFGPVVPCKKEPFSVPYYKRATAVLLYFSFDRSSYTSRNINYTPFGTDSKGMIRNFNWNGATLKYWWHKYFRRNLELSQEFLGHEGHAKNIDINKIAPANLPLMKRLKRIYYYVQDNIEYNPEATQINYLSRLVKTGQNSSWQGTLFYYYLLDKAKIPCHIVLIADRYSVTFTPSIPNKYLFSFAQAIMVKVPYKGNLFFMPGRLNLPFCCIPPEYQDSLAFWASTKKHDEKIYYSYTPTDLEGMDKTVYNFTEDVSEDGEANGTLTFSELGTPAEGFLRWHKSRQFWSKHTKKLDKDKIPSKKELKDQLSKRLGEEIELPGNALELTGYKLKSTPAKSFIPFEATCLFTSKNIVERVEGNKWLVYAFPTMAGYSNPFKEKIRNTPIWYDEGKKIVVEGVIKLPQGAEVLDIPNPTIFYCPNKAGIKTSVEKVEKDGVQAIHVKMEYDQPLIVGFKEYPAWKMFHTFLQRAAETKILVKLPEQGGFE